MNKTLATIALVAGAAGGAVGGIVMTDPNYIVIAPELDQQQQYIVNEVANDRVPQLKSPETSAEDIQKASLDYVVVAEYLGDNLQPVIEYCLKNRDPEECNLYNRVKTQIELQTNKLNQ